VRDGQVPRPVVVLGDLNADLTIQLPVRGSPGTSAGAVGEPVLTGGGTAGNTAAALGRLGAPVVFHGAVGDDGFGRTVASELRAGGVDTRGLVVTGDAPTCQVIALLEPDGGRHLVVWPHDMGALARFSPADVDDGLVEGAAWLHTTGMCLRHEPVASAVLEALRVARDAGVPTSLDLNLRLELWGLPSAVRDAVGAAVDLADVVFGSGPEELVPLARALDHDVASVEAAALALAGGVRTVVARLGAGGAVAATPDGRLVRAPAFEVVQRNPVGAGDAFNAGFIAASIEGLPLAEALRWGNAVGALKVHREGGARDLPNRTQVGLLLDR
jgi:sugar/nucleoside kinase (ribokinase family)